MKKTLTVIFVIAIIFFFVKTSQAAGKATINFTVENQKVAVGDSFNVNLIVDPRGEALDTVRAIIKFPADKLRAEFFKLGDLYPDAAPGNYIDNKKGVLSEGGTIFGGQVAKKGIFGIITFKALSSGNTTISLIQGTHLIRAGVEKISSTALGKITIAIGAGLSTTEQSPLVIQSQSHPDQDRWSANNNVVFNWSVADTQKIENFFYDFDQQPNTDPSTILENGISSKVFNKTRDGVWYFHLKGQQADKSFTPAVHYRVMIDTTPPKKFLPILDKQNIQEGSDVNLYFDTQDETSGLDRYEVAVDTGIPEARISPFILSGLKAGRHTIFVKAIDKAGNSTSNQIQLTVLSGSASQKVVNTFLSHWQRYLLAIVAILGAILVYLLIVLKKRE